MSTNLEIVGRVLRRYSDQDVDEMLSDVHPDVELDYSESDAHDASIYHGYAACRAFVQGRYEDFEERSLELVEVIDAPPNAVVAVGRMRGKGRASGVAVEARSVTLWTLRDGKVSQIKIFQTRAEALDAVGLRSS
jgi:ketosteroid isomerase-like protein